MDDRLKESISAMLDEEADELEIRRVLNHEDADALHEIWTRYHRISTIVSEQNYSHVDVRQAVSSQIMMDLDAVEHNELDSASEGKNELNSGRAEQRPAAEKAALEDQEVGNQKSYWMTAGLAASVVFALLIGFQQALIDPAHDNGIDGSDGKFLADNSVLTAPATEVADAALRERSSEFIDLGRADSASPEKIRHLDEYLLRHVENASFAPGATVTPIARVASFNTVEPVRSAK